jgi:L-aspartate oxidase
VLRSPWGLEGAVRQLQVLASTASVGVTGSLAAWEATNMLTVAAAVTSAALTRTESRGCHRRDDHPEPRPEWLTHLDVRLTIDGGLAVTGA